MNKTVTFNIKNDMQRKDLTILILSIILTFTMILGIMLSFFDINNNLTEFLHNPLFQFILITFVQFVIGIRFYKSAFSAIIAKTSNMDVLVVLGTTAAYI